MHPLAPTSPRIPQRVVVAGTPGAALAAFCERLAEVLDLPLVLPGDLASTDDLARLAAFDGWVTLAADDVARSALLPRTDLLVHLVHEEAGLRGLVKRTVRFIRAEAAPDLAWLEQLPLQHPEVAVVRVEPADAATWPDRLAAGPASQPTAAQSVD